MLDLSCTYIIVCTSDTNTHTYSMWTSQMFDGNTVYFVSFYPSFFFSTGSLFIFDKSLAYWLYICVFALFLLLFRCIALADIHIWCHFSSLCQWCCVCAVLTNTNNNKKCNSVLINAWSTRVLSAFSLAPVQPINNNNDNNYNHLEKKHRVTMTPTDAPHCIQPKQQQQQLNGEWAISYIGKYTKRTKKKP